jgi:dihydrolipoamide dehydrogenase
MVMGELPVETEVLVIGGGPGGYTAAFRAADLGFDVTLVTDEPELGGVCLLRGCIPSKTLLMVGAHAEAPIAEGALAVEMGALAQDVALTVHPHPTLSETIGEAAQVLLGSATHVFARKK